MPLDLPDGASCFVDSNIFYYAIVSAAELTAPCAQLLDRAVAGRIKIFTTVPALADCLHKVMASEAAKRAARPRAGLVPYLKRHPELVRQLRGGMAAVDVLESLPVNILPRQLPVLRAAAEVSSRRGLLTNDSVILATMRHHGLTDLATNDDDFDGLPDVRVWKPR